MSFLSAAFLVALPLAAAPILLHLFDRRRNVVIEWGAMQFLVEAATKRTSARKLKQWLLLLLRVSAVAALVLALSQPLLPGGWFGDDGRGETVFILDNSMSMSRTVSQSGEEMSFFDLAVDRAVSLLNETSPGDSVRVLLASPYPVWVTGGGQRIDSNSRSAMEQQLRKLRPTTGSSDLLSALFAAVQAEIDPTQKSRRIVLLTDGQACDWNISQSDGWKRFHETLKSTPVPTTLDVLDVSPTPQPADNLAVDVLRSSSTVVGVGQTFSLTAHVRNHSQTQAAACILRWQVGDEVVHQSQIPALGAGKSHDLVWSHSFSKVGVYHLSCSLEAGDDLQPDNQNAVIIEVVEKTPVVVLEGAADQAVVQRDAFFVQAALGWLDGGPLDNHGVHVPQVMDAERLKRMDLRGFHAVVVPNLTRFDEELTAKLRDFVSAGGGLWIALGPRTDVEAFNQLLFADGDGLSALAIDKMVEVKPETNGQPPAQSVTINVFGKQHPATVELLDSDRLDLGEVAVSQRFRFVPPPEGQQAPVLLELSNGEPLAVEKIVGRGRVIVQAVPLRLQWSELARSQAFVVMVRNWLSYLTQPLATRHNLAPGEPLAMRFADSDSRTATLHTPLGDSVELTGDVEGDDIVFQSGRTILPGDYRLELGPLADSVPFRVDRPAQESDLTRLTEAEHRMLSELSGLNGVEAASLSGSNQTDPLWPLLLMALIGLIAAELVLAGVIARERFGSEPIAETTQHWAEQPLTMNFARNPTLSDSVPPTPAQTDQSTRRTTVTY